jgi:hypothetical protein
MPLPDNLLDYSMLLCEKVLQEVDGAPSAIRLVDVFYLPAATVDLPRERQAIRMSLLVRLRLKPDDTDEHTLRVDLVRPSGERATVAESVPTRGTSKFPGVAGGINLIIQTGVIPKEEGQHYFALFLDGTEIYRTHFILRERESEATEQE